MPSRPQGLHLPTIIMLCLGLRPAVPCGRGDRAPPRKPPLATSRAFLRKAIRAGLTPSEGRAPHARNVGITPTETSPLFGHSPVANSPILTTCLGLRPARISGRAELVPPRKSPFALSPGFPREAIRPWLAHPSEGRLRTPAREAMPSPGGRPLWATGPSFAPHEYVIPRLASGPHLRTRRPHPSEKIALRAISGPSPARPCVLG